MKLLNLSLIVIIVIYKKKREIMNDKKNYYEVLCLNFVEGLDVLFKKV